MTDGVSNKYFPLVVLPPSITDDIPNLTEPLKYYNTLKFAYPQSSTSQKRQSKLRDDYRRKTHMNINKQAIPEYNSDEYASSSGDEKDNDLEKHLYQSNWCFKKGDEDVVDTDKEFIQFNNRQRESSARPPRKRGKGKDEHGSDKQKEKDTSFVSSKLSDSLSQITYYKFDEIYKYLLNSGEFNGRFHMSTNERYPTINLPKFFLYQNGFGKPKIELIGAKWIPQQSKDRLKLIYDNLSIKIQKRNCFSHQLYRYLAINPFIEIPDNVCKIIKYEKMQQELEKENEASEMEQQKNVQNSLNKPVGSKPQSEKPKAAMTKLQNFLGNDISISTTGSKNSGVSTPTTSRGTCTKFAGKIKMKQHLSKNNIVNSQTLHQVASASLSINVGDNLGYNLSHTTGVSNFNLSGSGSSTSTPVSPPENNNGRLIVSNDSNNFCFSTDGSGEYVYKGGSFKQQKGTSSGNRKGVKEHNNVAAARNAEMLLQTSAQEYYTKNNCQDNMKRFSNYIYGLVSKQTKNSKQVIALRCDLVSGGHNSHSQYSKEILKSHDLIRHRQIIVFEITNILIALLKLFKMHGMFCCFILFCSV